MLHNEMHDTLGIKGHIQAGASHYGANDNCFIFAW